MKILGAALFILCGGWMGLSRLRSMRRSMLFLEDMGRALSIMEAEIGLCQRAVPEIFELLGREGPGETREFFRQGAECSGTMSAGEAWRECLEALEPAAGAGAALRGLGAVLGVYDAARQCAEISSVRERLAQLREDMGRELAGKARSYPLLGASLAGIAAILII